MPTYFLGRGGGVVEMLTVADMGEGGVKNGPKSADVLYGRPLALCEIYFRQNLDFVPLPNHSNLI